MNELLTYHAVTEARRLVSTGVALRVAAAHVAGEFGVTPETVIALAGAAIKGCSERQAEIAGTPKRIRTKPTDDEAAAGPVEFLDAATTIF